MKRIIKSFIIAFSMYSKIPMPMIKWKEEDMKYVFCFFPLIGVITGGSIFAWNVLCLHFDLPEILRVFISASIPIIVTGGIHIDGYMDTMDAFHSYRDRQKKLEILKDPHIGAFSVIMLLLYGSVYIGALSVIKDTKVLACLGIVQILSRGLSAFLAVTLKSAKEGTLNLFMNNSSKIVVRVVIIAQIILCITGMFFLDAIIAVIVTITSLLTVIFYYLKTKKEFGGITGDTAGYFVVIFEGASLTTMAIFEIVKIMIQGVI